MRKINEEKLAKLSTTNQMLDEKYGVHGTETRDEFDEDWVAFFYEITKIIFTFFYVIKKYSIHL